MLPTATRIPELEPYILEAPSARDEEDTQNLCLKGHLSAYLLFWLPKVEDLENFGVHMTQITGASQKRRFCIIHLVLRWRIFDSGDPKDLARILTGPDLPIRQDEVRIAEDLIMNPEWQRDQDLIDNLESELHQALSRIEEYEAQLQPMHLWAEKLEETELTTQKKKFEEVKIVDRRVSASYHFITTKTYLLETNECQRLKLELEKVQTYPNIHDELHQLRSENADYVKQLEEKQNRIGQSSDLKYRLDWRPLTPPFFLSFLGQTLEASTADLRFHQEGHWLHDDVMINLADNHRTKIWSGGGEGPADIVGEENLHFDGKWSECGPVRPSSRASLSWSVITEATE
ncbi:hypothetical protein B0H14DRAFT_2619124 [Mycena olivaceomarginata]|nr:hypothetical protein B0H14DRAFT_2619124 [Mycena olivaceomarginata]